MTPIELRYDSGDRFAMRIRAHNLLVDQPVEDGGDDMGPSPVELFVASIASCAGFYAERFLKRRGMDPFGLRVSCDYLMADERPARVAWVGVSVCVPEPLTDQEHQVLERVLEHCTVKNSLESPPLLALEVRCDERMPLPA